MRRRTLQNRIARLARMDLRVHMLESAETPAPRLDPNADPMVPAGTYGGTGGTELHDDLLVFGDNQLCSADVAEAGEQTDARTCGWVSTYAPNPQLPLSSVEGRDPGERGERLPFIQIQWCNTHGWNLPLANAVRYPIAWMPTCGMPPQVPNGEPSGSTWTS